jgi:putative molybdopterin biosynthesis protein
MEAGDYVPNTAVALQLARALEVRVEELFFLEQEPAAPPKTAPVELLGAPAHVGQPVQVCRVGNNIVGVSAAPPAWGLSLADGIVTAEPSSGRTAVQVLQEQPPEEKRLLIAGCDPAISLLAQYLLRAEGIETVLAPSASRQALEWLKEGKAHIAGSHWKDDRTGEYNLPLVRRLFPQGAVQVVTFAVWEDGLVVAPGNPKSIRGVEDLARRDVTIVNREEGAGSRQLLDKRLAAAGIGARQVRGYNRLAHGHLPAALQVSVGQADCCLASRAAARAFGLDFLPLAVERYDLVFPRKFTDLSGVQLLLDALNRSAVRRKLESLAGYDTSHTGELLPVY